MAPSSRTTLLALAACALAFALPLANAHNPKITKSILMKQPIGIREGAVALDEGQDVGNRLIVKSSAALGGHGHFPRYQLCTAVLADPAEGVGYSCLSEVDFLTGTLVTQVSA
jgi:hypothetical protein